MIVKFLFKKICFPLLHINNSVYSFMSGIAISLSTNIFTTICIDDISNYSQWNLFVSTIAFTIVSATLLYMVSKMSGFQGFVNNTTENFDTIWKETIILEATKEDAQKWVISFFILFIFLIIGIVFLATDFSWLSKVQIIQSK